MSTARLIRRPPTKSASSCYSSSSRPPSTVVSSGRRSASAAKLVVVAAFSNNPHGHQSQQQPAGINSDDFRISRERNSKIPVVVVKAVASVAALSSTVTKQAGWSQEVLLDLPTLFAITRALVLRGLKVVTPVRPWKQIVQMCIEKVVLDCRFFTMFAVAGTLLGSLLCFLEGCFLVIESYMEYFKALSHHSDHGHIMQLLIEAIDMFLVGTAMLIFGMGLHVMFVGPRNFQAKPSQLPSSNLFGLFYLKELPSWVGMKSITQAKSKIGHALMLLLQVGVLEKFKSIPLVNGLDLACFAAAVFVSSAGLFILSRLNNFVETQDG